MSEGNIYLKSFYCLQYYFVIEHKVECMKRNIFNRLTKQGEKKSNMKGKVVKIFRISLLRYLKRKKLKKTDIAHCHQNKRQTPQINKT